MEPLSDQKLGSPAVFRERPTKHFYIIAGMRLAIDLIKIGLIRLGQ